jgi:hypothetical protein
VSAEFEERLQDGRAELIRSLLHLNPGLEGRATRVYTFDAEFHALIESVALVALSLLPGQIEAAERRIERRAEDIARLSSVGGSRCPACGGLRNLGDTLVHYSDCPVVGRP